MKAICLLLILCLLPCTAYASHDWSQRTMGIQHDKWFHVGAGMFIDQYLKTKKVSWLERKGWVLFAGVVKEATDKRFDVEDLGATVLGGLLSDVVRLEIKF